MLKAKWHEMKRLFTDHLSDLTHACLEEEALQTGHAAVWHTHHQLECPM